MLVGNLACDLRCCRDFEELLARYVFLAGHKGSAETHLFLQKSFLGYRQCYLLILPLLPALAGNKSLRLSHS